MFGMSLICIQYVWDESDPAYNWCGRRWSLICLQHMLQGIESDLLAIGVGRDEDLHSMFATFLG